MSCPDCKDGFYYPLVGERTPCLTCSKPAYKFIGKVKVSSEADFYNAALGVPHEPQRKDQMLIRLGRSNACTAEEYGRYSWYRRGKYPEVLHRFDGFKATYIGLRNVMVPIMHGASLEEFVYDDDPRFKDLYDESRIAGGMFFKPQGGPAPSWTFAMEAALNCDWISEPCFWLITPILARDLVLGMRGVPGFKVQGTMDPRFIGKTLVIEAMKWKSGNREHFHPKVTHEG